jgi:hypothetical protein
MTARETTPPAQITGTPSSPGLTPEQIKQIVRLRDLPGPRLIVNKEINRIKAKAKLQKWELDQMARKHDEEQKKKNAGAELRVSRKFMNYIEYGRPPDRDGDRSAVNSQTSRK